MDWNKSNIILIIAFIILNIFLLLATFSDTFTDNTNIVVNENFKNNVENLLKRKNIYIKCEIPKDVYILPVYETEYDIIEINNELIQKYLGKGIEAQDEVHIYNNDKNETLEIIDNKKIIYTLRAKVSGELQNDEFIKQEINNFLEEKNIDKVKFFETSRHEANDSAFITFTEKYNDYYIDNSYMHFYVDKKGIYKFEMQRANSVVEIMDKIRLVSAIEALPRLVTYDDIKDKEIQEIQMTYYSNEDGNWKNINKTNSDPTWKVVFSDGTEKHLPSYN